MAVLLLPAACTDASAGGDAASASPTMRAVRADIGGYSLDHQCLGTGVRARCLT
jgi:hypothetical protein